MNDAMATPDKKKKGTPDEWELGNALDTLQKAEQIKNDPHLMKHVHKHAKKKIKEIRSIADLKSIHKDMVAEENKEGE